eukprot:TRINITY_DN24048_c0_g1_i1.p1 TRINITY_DN24048_c0_g1~~TRINITY_DN24048_c0_g1_i1.p1  ORF type:complete len:283 (-),score=63.09 TRINITY_DN24048_c0_g1_i1:245-1093(-)
MGLKRDPKTSVAQHIYQGAVLQCLEAASLGMPFEVWKTRMGRFRTETTMEAFNAVYRSGGVSMFWQGVGPKMVESATKGGVLLVSKESIKDSCLASGISPTLSGFIAGAGGGVCQVSVMGPCTFLVTAMVTGGAKGGVIPFMRKTWGEKGVKGFYPGGSAIAFRQATNWASRQGFTDAVRSVMLSVTGGNGQGKLTAGQEVMSGMMGGFLACWNHPFEVARIEMQARAAAGESKKSMVKVLRDVHQEFGVKGLFQGVIPRIGLGIWQTLFMVTGANLLREYL